MPNDPNRNSNWARYIELLRGGWAVIRAVIPFNSDQEELFTEDNPGVVEGVDGVMSVSVTNAAGAPTEAERQSVTAFVTFLAGGFISSPFDMRKYVGGNVYIPAAWTNADIGFKVAPTLGGTYEILHDDNGNIVQSTVGAAATDEVYAFPPELMAARFVRLWSQLAGVNVVQVAERIMVYELKS